MTVNDMTVNDFGRISLQSHVFDIGRVIIKIERQSFFLNGENMSLYLLYAMRPEAPSIFHRYPTNQPQFLLALRP